MSVKVMAQVWELNLPTTKKLVLLALADHANDQGEKVYPSVARVAWKSGLSIRQTRRVMAQLRDVDHLLVLVREGDGRGHPNQYRIDLTKGDKLTPFEEWRSSVTADDDKGDTDDHERVSPMTGGADTHDTQTVSQPSENHNPTGSTQDVEEVKPIPLNKYYVNQVYERLLARYDVTLRPHQFGFQLSQMQRMLDQYKPTDDEISRVIEHMVEKYPSSPKMDALTAIQDVKLGRDNGEAWSGPAPWEKAKQEREPINPHSDKGEELRGKPRRAIWYVSVLGREEEFWQSKIDGGATHEDLMNLMEEA